MPRVAMWLRLGSGAAIALAVVLAAVVSGSTATLDPAPALLFAVIAGAALGGRRGGVAAATVGSLAALVYFAQPAWVGSPGNAVRVLLLIGSAGLTVALVGPLREVVDNGRDLLSRRAGLTEGMQAFGQTIGEAPDDGLVDVIVGAARRLVEADLVVLTIFDPRTGRHVIRAVAGSPPSAVGVEVLPGVGVTGQAIRDGRTVLAGNPNRPLLAVPAIHSGQVVATLTVGRDGGKPGFNDQDRLCLDVVAPTLALTVGNWLLRHQLREAAIRDPQSGLYNRAYLDAAFEQLLALRRRTPAEERTALTIVLFDLDDFRAFNEAHGRKAGDAVVRAVGAVLRQRFRASDLMGRIGGDGFLVVLDGAELEVASRAAAEVRARIHALALTDERGARLAPSISAGCATFRGDAERSETMIRAVEAALDTARWSGPGAIVAI